jgi:NAD(P)H-quinone oxidoreductase subunit 5
MDSWWTSLQQHVAWVPVYPLLAFALIVLLRGVLPAAVGKESATWQHWNGPTKTASMLLTVGATFLGLLHTLPFVYDLLTNSLHVVEMNQPWLQAGDLVLSIGYRIDPMSVMMLFVVTFISLFIQIYTHGYMGHDEGYAKFYGYLALFNFSMLGLVLSTNLFQMYVFWELVGVSSYLLIGFWYTRPDAAAASIKAFLMNRVGDFGLLIGILSLLFFTYGWWQSYLGMHPSEALLGFSGIAALVAQSPAWFKALPIGIIAFLIFMGPMAKSAQVPLHTWLPDAMAGPTPISALIHAATMVAAGIYLVGRVYPLFAMSHSAMAAIAIMGTVTAVVGATIALTQTDIKKALAYSTCSQLGFMMAAMGCGVPGAGLFHLFTHAFFKAMLFLCSGSVIHACEDEQDMRHMGGLWSKLPVTAITYLIGTIAISGLFLTSGFWSKDSILAGAQAYSKPIFWTLAATAGMTAFYMFRTFIMTFMGSYRGSAHVHHEMPVMVAPLAVLAVPSIAIGWALSGQSFLPGFETLITGHLMHGGGHHAVAAGNFTHTQIGWLSSGIGLTGALLAMAFYWKPLNFVPGAIQKACMPVYTFFAKKWYFDEVYNAFVSKVYMVFANASSAFDKGVIDGLVTGVGSTIDASGGVARQLQSGRVQTYIAVIFFGLVVLSLLGLLWWH